MNSILSFISYFTIIEYINENPDAYLSEIVQEFNCTHVAVLKSLGKLDIT